MKNNFYPIWFAVIGCSMLFAACSSDDSGKTKMTDQQLATRALAEGSPWSVLTVVSKPDGTDEELLDDFQLTFGSASGQPSSFSSTSEDLHLASDPGATWEWADAGVSTIILKNAFTNELVNATYTPSVEKPSTITVTFVLSGEGGRKKGLGEYVVTLQ